MRQILCGFLLLAFGYSPVLAASKYEESVKELAEGVASEAIKMKKSRLAVLDFVDSKGDVTPIGQFLAEELATHLLVAGELKVVDHKLLAATMAKHQLTHLETSQAKAAKKVAKALRADLFVTGAYLEIPEGVQVTAKLIGPYTVYPVGAARAIVRKSEASFRSTHSECERFDGAVSYSIGELGESESGRRSIAWMGRAGARLNRSAAPCRGGASRSRGRHAKPRKKL